MLKIEKKAVFDFEKKFDINGKTYYFALSKVSSLLSRLVAHFVTLK